jgi:hypothetical protein
VMFETSNAGGKELVCFDHPHRAASHASTV